MTPEQQRVIDECNVALASVQVESIGYRSTIDDAKIGGGTKNPK